MIKTLSIKSSIHALLINEGLRDSLTDYEIPSDKTKWKYYLNVSGEYHSSDSLMQVTSLDTREIIIFSKENLEIHVATADAYRYGSREYYSLVNKYPDKENLILGILNPCDINKAVDSEDGTILSYDSRYVESQEMTLIPELESYIKRHMARWTVSSYRTSDNLYHAADHAILCMNLIPVLFNLRVKRCKTDEAHSFHIRQYLASHFELEEHYDYLTMGQRLYLYRNLMRISKNFGRNEQFYELVKNILEKRHIPLASYTVRQLRTVDDEQRPNITTRRDDVLNPDKVSAIDYREIDKVYDKERFLFPWNEMEFNDHEKDITRLLQNGASGVVQTKVLESHMTDYTNASPDRLNEVLLRELVHYVYQGNYLAYCAFRDPKTGVSHSVSVRTALIYMLYIAHKLAGMDVPVVPGAMACGYVLDPVPTKIELLTVADKRYEKRGLLADYLVKYTPRHKKIYSLDAFFKRGYSIYEQCLRHWDITSNTEDMYDRAEAEKMCNRIFGYSYFEFYDQPKDMETWLIENDLPAYDRTNDDAKLLLTNIFVSVTGLSIDNSRRVPFIQKSLIELMKKLTSYSVQYVREINEEPLLVQRRISVRTSKPMTTGFSTMYHNPLVDVISMKGFVHDQFEGDLTDIKLETSQSFRTPPIEIDPIIEIDMKVTLKEKIDHLIESPRVTAYKSTGEAYSDQEPFIGYDFYKTLTQEQIKSIPN